MIEKNKNIHLDGNEALEIIKKLDQYVVSLDKIKSYHADPRNEKTAEEENHVLANYIIERKLGPELAYIRGVLSSKFDLSLGEDDMDDVERYCDTNTYWSPKKKINPKSDAIDNWYKEQVPVLKTAIINEFDYLYHYLQKKKQDIYGYSLILDDDCLTAYGMASTIQSLKKIHKNCEWSAEEWCLGVNDKDVLFGMDAFTKIVIDFYDAHIVPQFKKGFDYEPIRAQNLALFMEGMKLAKENLVEKYGTEIHEMAFFLTIPGEPNVTKDSVLYINLQNSKKVQELLEDLW